MSATSSTEPAREVSPTAAVVIAGPTASGKSALGLALAAALDGVIVNADSQQRYGDLPILTAQPSAEERLRVPHRLFGDLAADESGTAAEWAMRAADEIRTVCASGRLPILVGGTGLYLRALMEGIADVPRIPIAVRTKARALLDDIGNAAFHAALVARDPEAARLAPGDRQRMLRTFEVIEATGVSLFAWQVRATRPPLSARYFKILLLPPRETLYAACDARFRTMVDRGAVDEVKAVMAKGGASAPAMKVLGARPLAQHLSGEITLESAITAAQTATRHYAKRQMTWFRHQFSADHVIGEQGDDVQILEQQLSGFLAAIRAFCRS